MGNSNTTVITTNVNNQFLTQAQQNCAATAFASASGNRIIVGPSGTTGDINITASSTASASCMMANYADSAVTNIIANSVKQTNTAVTDIMGILDFKRLTNRTEINNALANYITQITTQTCQADANGQANDNFVLVEGVSKDINIDATANASAACTINNITKIQAYNDVQANVSQSNTSLGMFATIGIIIVGIAIVGGIVFLLMYSGGSTGKAVSGDPFSSLDPDVINELLPKATAAKAPALPPRLPPRPTSTSPPPLPPRASATSS